MYKKPMNKLQKLDAAVAKKAISVKPIALKAKSKPKGSGAEATKKDAPTKKPAPETEVNVEDFSNDPVKDITLIWTKAKPDQPKDSKMAGHVKSCDGNGDFMDKVKDAYYTIQFGKPPLACILQFGNVRLEMRIPSESWRAKPLPPAAHLITVNLQHFSTPEEFVKFIDKKTKEQIDNSAFDCRFEGPETTSDYSSNANQTKLSRIRETISAKWKYFISILHWILLVLAIIGSLLGLYVNFFVTEPDSIWIRVFNQIKDFLYNFFRVLFAPLTQ